jgi:hypothetical protein
MYSIVYFTVLVHNFIMPAGAQTPNLAESWLQVYKKFPGSQASLQIANDYIKLIIILNLKLLLLWYYLLLNE